MFNSDDAFNFKPSELDVEIYDTLIELKCCLEPRIDDLGESYHYNKWNRKATLGYLSALEAYDLQNIGRDDVEVIPNVLKCTSEIVSDYFASLNLASDDDVRKQHLEHEDFDCLLNSYRKLVGLTGKMEREEKYSAVSRNLMHSMSISLRNANDIVERWQSDGKFPGYFTRQTSVYCP